MSDEKKESWGAVVGGCFLWLLIISALTYGIIMVVLWFKGIKDTANKQASSIKESMLPVGNAEVFSIDTPFNTPLIAYRAKIGDAYYVIVQGWNGSVSICPEPTTKKAIIRGVDEVF